MADTDAEVMHEIAANTKAIAQLLALSVASDVRANIASILGTPQRRAAYEASDGKRSAREIGRLVKATHPTIGRWWIEWKRAGLVIDADGGRMKATLDLELFGLAGPLAVSE